MVGKTEFVVIGLNSIGRTLAGLLALGEGGTLTLIDDQKVVNKHLDQGYLPVDLGTQKTEAVKAALQEVVAFLSVTCLDRLSQEVIENLGSKISGNTILFYCEPTSPLTRAHIYKSLQNSCNSIYFFGFDEDGVGIIYPTPLGIVGVDSASPVTLEGKEAFSEGRAVAARAFSIHVRASALTPVH